jgi:uncharacterized SAM-binding protein YcdF (DUF218 family)
MLCPQETALSVKGIVIVLGAANDEDGHLSGIAVERCEQAIVEYRQHPGYKILPTGGYGPRFNVTDKPHAFYTRQYLAARGIPADDVLEFASSANTLEDAQFSRPIVEKHGVEHIVVVTSDFHVPRVRYIFEREFHGIELTFSGCATHLPQAELEARKRHEEQALAELHRQATQAETLNAGGHSMAFDQSYIAENTTEREHLIALVNRLTDQELAYPLEAGGTVSAVLAHLAFWDLRASVLLDKWAKDGIGPSPIDTDVINEATRLLCRAISPRASAELAISSAQKIDREIEQLSAEQAADIEQNGKTVRLNRAHHRREHLGQIEQAVGQKLE